MPSFPLGWRLLQTNEGAAYFASDVGKATTWSDSNPRGVPESWTPHVDRDGGLCFVLSTRASTAAATAATTATTSSLAAGGADGVGDGADGGFAPAGAGDASADATATAAAI